MKASDIAKENSISLEEVGSICKDLGIAFEGAETDMQDNDAFLVKKRVETVKKEKAAEIKKKMKEQRGKKKIKLKRKVTKNPHSGGSEEPEKAEKSSAEKPAPSKAKPTSSSEKDQSRKPRPERSSSNRNSSNRPSSGRPDNKRSQGNTNRSKDRPNRDNKDNRDRPQRPSRPQKPGQRNFTSKPFAENIEGAEDVSSKTDSKKSEKRSKRKERDKEKENRKYKKTEKQLKAESFFKKSKPAPKRREPVKVVPVTPDSIEITENISVGDLAKKLNVKANEVIASLIKLGVMATINQVLDSETAEIVASEFGTDVNVVSLYDETVIHQKENDNEEDHITRPPIVTVMGHVDHGKTKLLDSIRSANVADGEHGGITQHIGAYQVTVNDQKVTFLDTPGHAAFTTMRARGASVTDIVILVVAANDGVMPQTIEAINHAKDANVPIIVAINKIDLPEASPDKVKQELTAYGLIPEEWGGETLFCEISAKQNINIDSLLEMILMQAEILELNANPKLMAQGTVIESKLDPGRGPVSSLLVQDGTLKVGDPFVVGIFSGKIRAMFDDKGNAIEKAGPSKPVEILGVDGIPAAGDPFQQVDSERYSKQIAQKRQELKRIESAKQVKKVTLEDLNDMIKEGEVQELRLLIKADVDGSVQALKDSLEKLSNSEVKVKVIHAAAGGINESDVMLASASNAIIIGYHVRPTPKISDLAEQEKVSIKTYNIIFEVTQDVKSAMEGMLIPDIEEVVTGAGEVKQTFKISKVGTIAGAVIVKGKVERNNKVRLMRDGVVIYDGELNSLKHYKDDANSVNAGQECGFGLANYNDIKVGDTFESYKTIEVAKKLED